MRHLTRLLALTLVALTAVLWTARAPRAAANPSLALQPVAGSFNRITDIAHAGDDRLFIVEQRGVIIVLQTDGTRSTFLDIIAKVDSAGNEQGLLGLAFHPNYATNGYFYVNYTYDPPGSNPDRTRIERYRVSAVNPNAADPASATVILELEQDFSNHNGGDLNFGPDGYLYAGLGDGGSGGDPNGRGQQLTTLLGKLLRLDVDLVSPHLPDCDISGAGNYRIPADNPRRDGPGGRACDEIWALGLRNPWRFSFDRLTGDMWTADVGQNLWEEVNFEPAGSAGNRNYGWNCYEGSQPYSSSPSCQPPSAYTMPVYEYSHSAGGTFNCSVTGGYVYRGAQYPGLYGRYFFADYCSRVFWSLQGSGGAFTATRHGTLPVTAGQAFNSPTTFGEGADGALYVAGTAGSSNWTVFRLIDNTPSAVATSAAEAQGESSFALGTTAVLGGALLLLALLIVLGRVVTNGRR